jgi:hypothetical protein
LLAELCERFNSQSLKILNSIEKSPHEKYLALYRHLQKSDAIIALCFNDWRRSTLSQRLIQIQHHGLLSPEHFNHMSGRLKEVLAYFSQLEKPE